MKRLMVAALFLLVLVLVSCGENSDTRGSIVPTGSTEVLSNVFDDQSSVYIRVADLKQNGADAAIAEIMTKKKSWEKQFPNKKIVAMSIVTGDGGGYGHPIVVGLLIHYEFR